MNLNPLALSTLFLLSSIPASAAPTTALKYAENGNWYVHVVAVDPEGYPDTLEKSAYATEAQAEERLRDLNRTRATVEAPSVPKGEPTYELRNPAAGEIWEATETWSTEWEDRFAEWIRVNFDAKFFKRYGIKTDCADATVALRWIFSRVAGLPAGNRLAGGGGLMTNRSVRTAWKDLPTATDWYDDARFRAALEYVLVNTYTHSVNADAYPIEIGEKWLKEGAFHLELRNGDGHTRVFTEIARDGAAWPLKDMYSNVPRKVRKLAVEPFTVYVQPPMNSGGILRHRWVRLADASATLVLPEEMPGYSLEQYRPDFFRHPTADFSVEVAARLRESLDPLIGMRAVIENLERAISERKGLVEEGYALCAKEDCAPGTGNYEDWSTPSRDARIGQYFEQIANYPASLQGDNLKRAQELFAQEREKKLLKFDGKKLRYAELAAIWKAKAFSSDPRDLPAKRWGQ